MLTEQYLNLVKSTLLNEIYVELEAQLLMSVLCASQNLVLDLPDFWQVRNDSDFLEQLQAAKESGDSILLETQLEGNRTGVAYDLRNFTEFSYTLVGRRRLDDLQACVEDVLDCDVPGDFLEAGVWRGGCCILMRAILMARDCRDRRVWLADSFEGLPKPSNVEDSEFAMDASILPVLAVTMDEVRGNFHKFDLLDEQIRFLPGWFKDSLPESDTGPLALLRIDCDLYDSTREVLEGLYTRVSPGGWVIIDDYSMLPPCRKAVDEFRESSGITTPLEHIDDHAVKWRVPPRGSDTQPATKQPV